MSSTFPKRARAQDGFAAIVAVFILVVLGGLGVVLVTVFTGQQKTSAYDALGARAYQAANAGIEVGTYRALTFSACGTTVFALAPFTVNVVCTTDAAPHNEAGVDVAVYRITATACNRPPCPGVAGEGYIERQLRATVVNALP